MLLEWREHDLGGAQSWPTKALLGLTWIQLVAQLAWLQFQSTETQNEFTLVFLISGRFGSSNEIRDVSHYQGIRGVKTYQQLPLMINLF